MYAGTLFQDAELQSLKKQVQKLQELAETSSVDDALERLMHLAHTPATTSRSQLIASLRALVDRATVAAHPKLQRFRAVLAQFESNDFGREAGRLIVLLLGNREEEEIASKVSKFMRYNRRTRSEFDRFRPYNKNKNESITCYVCAEKGHVARVCPKKQSQS